VSAQALLKTKQLIGVTDTDLELAYLNAYKEAPLTSPVCGIQQNFNSFGSSLP